MLTRRGFKVREVSYSDMRKGCRNLNGTVILYADQMTGSMERAIDESNRRREIQLQYNKDIISRLNP
jgi:excinuclease ABC subunit B